MNIILTHAYNFPRVIYTAYQSHGHIRQDHVGFRLLLLTYVREYVPIKDGSPTTKSITRQPATGKMDDTPQQSKPEDQPRLEALPVVNPMNLNYTDQSIYTAVHQWALQTPSIQ